MATPTRSPTPAETFSAPVVSREYSRSSTGPRGDERDAQRCQGGTRVGRRRDDPVPRGWCRFRRGWPDGVGSQRSRSEPAGRRAHRDRGAHRDRRAHRDPPSPPRTPSSSSRSRPTTTASMHPTRPTTTATTPRMRPTTTAGPAAMTARRTATTVPKRPTTTVMTLRTRRTTTAARAATTAATTAAPMVAATADMAAAATTDVRSGDARPGGRTARQPMDPFALAHDGDERIRRAGSRTVTSVTESGDPSTIFRHRTRR